MSRGQEHRGSGADEVLVERAHAKINLGLKVLGRRPDGFHDICSIAQSLDLADVLRLRPASRTRLTCTDPTLSNNSDNLVLQAAALFHSRLGSPPQAFDIHLEKNIPLGAGLGGGSADAAALLRALNGFYGQPFTRAQLLSLAGSLGSDVPFMIEGGTALMRGRGECLEPLMWRGAVDYVLTHPGIELNTAWAYGHVAPYLTPDSSYLNFVASISGGCVDPEALFAVLENDFQPLVERTYPIVAQVSSYLRLAGARVCSMSGSGSTVFGIFDDRNAAHDAQQQLRARGYRSFLCRPRSSPARC